MIAAAVHPGTVADQQHLKRREKLSVIGRGGILFPRTFNARGRAHQAK
jgi:hypothetical protein